MLNIQFSYDKEFVDCLEAVRSKYGEEVFEQSGVGKKQLDFDHFSRTFYNKKATQSMADIVVDSNANVSEGSVIAYAVEGFKPHLRLNSIYLMWKYSKRRNGLDFANKVVEGEITGCHYTHDLHLYGTAPYCYAFSAYDLVTEGLPFINKINSRPAKHYDTFIEHMVQAIVYYSNSIAGACAIPDFFPCLSYFIDKDIASGYLNGDDELLKKKIEQSFQIFVYSVNQPFRGGLQSNSYANVLRLYKKNNDNIEKYEKIKIGEFADRYFSGSGFKDVCKENYYVESLNKITGINEIKEVTGIHRHEIEHDMYQYITVLGQEIEVTKNHSLFRLTKDLDIIECQVEDNPTHVLIPFGGYKPDRVELDGFLIDEDIAYLIGQYLGDGEYSTAGMNIHAYNTEFYPWAKDAFSSSITISLNKGNATDGTNGYTYLGMGRDFMSMIEKYFGKGSHNKFISPLIWNSDNIMYLIQGIIDSDGNITKNRSYISKTGKVKSGGEGKVRISSVNKGLLYDIQAILLRLGILSSIGEVEREGFGKMSTIYSLRISNFYKLSGKIKKSPFIYNDKKISDPTRRWVDLSGYYTYLVRNLALNPNKLGVCSYDWHNFGITEFKELVEFINNSIEQYKTTENRIESAKFLFMPLNNGKNCRLYKLEGFNKHYSLFGNGCHLDIFDELAELRYQQLKTFCEKIKILDHCLPIKIKSLKKVDYDLPYVYDISVKDNENFNTECNIYAHNSPFTNISVMDYPFMKSLFGTYIFPDGNSVNYENVMKLQKMFVGWFNKEWNTNVFTFPVMTACVSIDDTTKNVLDEEFLDWATEENLPWGLLNFYVGTTANLSSCCRLRNNLKEANQYMNSFGAGGTQIGCYDQETEVLTNNGWKLFKDLLVDDKILTLNKDTKVSEYQIPTAYFEYKVDNTLHEYKSRIFDLLVTSNHNMLVESVNKKGKPLEIIQSDKIKNTQSLYRGGGEPKFSGNNEEYIKIGNLNIKTDLFFTFMGMYIGDGGITKDYNSAKEHGWEIPIYCGKKENDEEIINVLRQMNLTFNAYKNRDSSKFVVYSKDLWEYLSEIGNVYEKFIPNSLLQYDRKYLMCLFNGLMITDGNNKVSFKNNSLIYDSTDKVEYYTVSKKLADSVQHLYSLLGYSSRIRKRKQNIAKIKDRIIHSREFIYCIIMYRARTRNIPLKIRKNVQYNGMVYCVEVPNHVLMVRRNGISTWSCNSHRVVTLNLPHLALDLKQNVNIDKKSPDFKEQFNIILDRYLSYASDILITHRKIMEKRIKQGVLPLYTLNLMNLRKQFSTIGIVGIYEMLHTLGLDMEKEEGKDFVEKMIDRITLHNKEMKLKTGYLWNTEQVPAENVAIKLAKKDRYIFGDAQEFDIYSNQFYPLTLDIPMIERIITQGRFDSKLDGGSIMHLSLNDRVKSKEQMKKLIIACKDSGVCYFAVNHQINKCDNEHTTIGKNGDHCPVCGSEKIEKYTRVVGFFTNVSSWHKVRREEFKNRAFYQNGSQDVKFEDTMRLPIAVGI